MDETLKRSTICYEECVQMETIVKITLEENGITGVWCEE